MKTILRKVLDEPAVAIGLVLTILYAIVTITTTGIDDIGDIPTILGPLATSLGIRPFVTPVAAPGADPELLARELLDQPD